MKDHFPQPAGCTPANTAQDVVGFPATRVYCWLMLNFSTRTTIYFYKAAFQSFSTLPVLLHRLIHPRCRTLCLPFSNFVRFLSDYFSSLTRYFWIVCSSMGNNRYFRAVSSLCLLTSTCRGLWNVEGRTACFERCWKKNLDKRETEHGHKFTGGKHKME